MHKPETSKRLLKWIIELEQLYLEYKPQSAMKSQANEFIIDFPLEGEEDAHAIITEVSVTKKQVKGKEIISP